MRRCWLGVGLLALLLGAGIWAMVTMDRIHSPISSDLDQAAEAALAGDWETGEALALSARADWNDNWHRTASVADHEPMDEIDGLFAELGVYARRRETMEFAACCAKLSKLVQAMGDAHSFSWWNLL